ncbi:MAG: C-terminal processing protease CtpA/Prc [Candidatus Promineifilaceae bacterium]|jgi:C-terminal processing protease CtpA/Prc
MKKTLIVLAISLMLAIFAAVSFASPRFALNGGDSLAQNDGQLPSQDDGDGDGEEGEDGEEAADTDAGTDTAQEGDGEEDEEDDPNPYPELILNGEEGGLVGINGLVTYTNPFFGAGTVQPLVILEDQTGFVDRNTVYIFPLESQVLGQITTDFKQSPFSYSMVLPIEPRGGQRDVDNDGIDEAGVQIYAPAYWDNTYGGPFLEERDMSGGGWSTAYASTVTSSELETQREIIGGKLVVYSPDDTQEFPINFGEDGLLFTDDEQEMVILPQGWTVVNLDEEPFTFDRSRTQDIPLLEPEGAALIDYSDLSYTEAFDALVEEFRENYAFSDIKGLDWDELKEEYMPLFEEAEENESNLDYRRALRSFLWEIPDGHVSGGFVREDFIEAISGGIGMGIRDVDDGRVIVNYLLEAGPAADADILLGAEIVAINGVTVTNYVDDSVAWSAPFSTEHNRRLQKLRYATRFEADSEVSIEFINPEETDVISITVSTMAEFDSFSQSSFFSSRTGLELPVEFDLLDEGIGYVEITGFLDNQLLTVQLWERMINNLNENDIDTLVIDMRQNGGGFGFLADMMASYFYDETFVTGNAEEFDEDLGEFVTKPENARSFILPPDRSMYYDGTIAVLVGPACASACEFFSYDMTINNRATIIGQYPSAGLGGSVSDLQMPDGESVRYTVGRAVDGDGNIHIEGIGVQPDIVVPVTADTLFADGDVVLQTAIDFLEGSIEAPSSSEESVDSSDFEFAASLVLGDVATGTLEAGQSVFYEVSLIEGDVADILAVAEDMLTLDLVMNVYDETGELVDSNDDIGVKNFNPGFLAVEAPQDFIFVIEISAFDEEATGNFTFEVVPSEATEDGSDG